jgi:hypothetical protein
MYLTWNEGNMSLFDFLSPVKNSMFTSMIFIYSWIWSYDHWWPTQWPHSVKRLRSCWIPPVSFSRRIRQYFIYNMCFFSKQFHTCANALPNEVTVGHQWSYDHIHEYMNIMLVNIEFFTGSKKIKQWIIYISFFRLNRILTELHRIFFRRKR